MNDNIPKVSICIPTYNHENFVRNCLDSILEQKCNFNYEIIIGDDCSTDNNRKIINEYFVKYPTIIKPIFHEKNIGGEKNYLSVHKQAIGEYVCHLDGDDYMLPGKLQAQVDFMDKTRDCNICFHRVKALFPDGTIKDDLIDYEKIKDGFERKDLLMYMAVATHSSKMYRRDLKNFDMPKFTISDFYMNIEQIQKRKAYFINDKCYGVYRVGIGQSTNSKIAIRNFIIETLDFFLAKYQSEKKYINSLYLVLFLADFKNDRDFVPYMKGWLKSFCFSSIFLTIKTWKIRRMFRING